VIKVSESITAAIETWLPTLIELGIFAFIAMLAFKVIKKVESI
jgi:hypothetical protein